VTEDLLRNATRKVAATARRHLGPHPSPEELIAYQAGELSSVQEERLQAHFALCPDCTATVLDLGAFPNLELRVGAPGPLKDLIPDWQSVRERLSEEEPVDAMAQTRGSLPWREKLLVAVAASFFLATVGLSYRVNTLEQRLVKGEVARGNVPLFTLAAEGVDRIRGQEQVSVSSDRFNLMLFVANPGSYKDYSLEAVSGRDQRSVIWRLENLVPTSEGIFLISDVSRRELPPGPYLLRLYGGAKRLAEYQVLFQYDKIP
jgi:putative zinc finger protein